MNSQTLPYGGPRVSQRVSQATLSETERDVLELICDGYSNAAISRELNLSVPLVSACSSTLSALFGARNRAHLAALAIRAGLIERN